MTPVYFRHCPNTTHRDIAIFPIVGSIKVFFFVLVLLKDDRVIYNLLLKTSSPYILPVRCLASYPEPTPCSASQLRVRYLKVEATAHNVKHKVTLCLRVNMHTLAAILYSACHIFFQRQQPCKCPLQIASLRVE